MEDVLKYQALLYLNVPLLAILRFEFKNFQILSLGSYNLFATILMLRVEFVMYSSFADLIAGICVPCKSHVLHVDHQG